MRRGGGSRAQELVRAGVVPTTPRSLERVRREISHLLVVLCRPGNFLFVFSLRCVGFSCSSVLKKLKAIAKEMGSWIERGR